MGLTTSMSHALSGLRSIETGLETVSRNISNAGVAGYAKRRVMPLEIAGGGVIASDVQRELDSVVQRHLRVESGAAAYTDASATYLGRLDQSFGVPGGAGSLDSLFDDLTAKLQTLASEPANASARLSVISAAQGLSGGLNRLGSEVQALRTDAEGGIEEAASEANAALKMLADTERELSFFRTGNAKADLLDQRDKALDTLSRLMDIRVEPRGADGAISVYTTSGLALFTGNPARFDFETKGPLLPHSLASDDPALSGVGVLRLVSAEGGVNVIKTGDLRSGEIAALMNLRDNTLPAMQEGLDSIAAGLANAATEAGVSLFVDRGNGVATTPFTGGAQQLGFANRITVDPALTRDPTGLAPSGSPQRARAMLTALQETARSFAPVEDGSAPFNGSVDGAIRHVLNRQGAQSAEAVRLNEGQAVVLNALQERFSEGSGVSVDQEMAQLVELQNAYAANARVMSAVQDMYDALLNI